MRPSHLLATAGTISVLGLAPSSAHAALSSVTATPSVTQAGAHADFSLDMAFAPGDDVRSIVLHLPKGFVGNPQAPALCTQSQFAADACPAPSQVGTTTVTATVTPNGLLPQVTQTQAVSGRVYNLQPRAGEPARLGVLLPSSAALGGLVTTQPVRLQSVVSVRTSGDYGLDSTLADLPRTIDTNVGTLASHIDRIQLQLTGHVPGGAQPFLTNPTTCVPATTTVDATSYGGGATRRSSSFTPTGCDRLVYDPRISATLDGAGPRQHPQLTTVVSQGADEATSSKVVVTLPLGVGPDLSALNTTCPSADFDAGTCADATKVGSATAQTPLLADPLTGPVYLVARNGGGLPQLGIAFGGLLPVKLRASVTVGAGARLVSTLDGLPDVPLSSFTLVLDGGDRGLLRSDSDLCAAAPTIDAAFTAQNGVEHTAGAVVDARNCATTAPPVKPRTSPKARKPAVSARLTGRGLTVRARVPAGAAKLRGLRVTLPRGLRADAARRLRTRSRGARQLSVRISSRHLRRGRLSGHATVRVVARTASRGYTMRVKLRR
jgi:hypothetical protein